MAVQDFFMLQLLRNVTLMCTYLPRLLFDSGVNLGHAPRPPPAANDISAAGHHGVHGGAAEDLLKSCDFCPSRFEFESELQDHVRSGPNSIFLNSICFKAKHFALQ